MGVSWSVETRTCGRGLPTALGIKYKYSTLECTETMLYIELMQSSSTCAILALRQFDVNFVIIGIVKGPNVYIIKFPIEM